MGRNPFSNLHDEIPPCGLHGQIRASMARRRKNQLRIRIGVNVSVFVLSLSALFPAFNYLREEVATSGFFEYLSLAFSGGAIFSYWTDFAASLIESLPAIGIALTFAALFGVLSALRGIARARRIGELTHRFAVRA